MMNDNVLFRINSSQFFSPRDVYEAYVKSEDLDDYFYENYGVSYHFLFGDTAPDKFITNLLDSAYRNDFLIRYSFFNDVLSRNKGATSFFEFPINDSRADIVSINGKSVAYEIKTQYDTLDRLAKQVNDYSLAFEYVYVICDDQSLKNVIKIIPPHCGIYTYSRKNKLIFKLYKKATKSNVMDSEVMIKMFLQKEKNHYFEKQQNNEILVRNDTERINYYLKKALKHRFAFKTGEISSKCKSLF